jgi:hypothetical protein
MSGFWSTIPTGNNLLVFLLCLVVGSFVIYKYCLDQFGKPSVTKDDNDPWKFVVLRYQTPPRQYLIGFSIYFGLMILIFLAVSIVGPGPFFQILKAVVAGATQTDVPAPATTTDTSLQNYPTFPILVAFYFVGLNPNLPKVLDFEISLRRFAHRMAYIPKNIDGLINYMRFSDMDMPNDQLADAWSAVDLHRPVPNVPDLKGISSTFDRVVLLYARAATLAGDVNFENAKDLLPNLSLQVFQQYRTEIQNVGINLQAVDARLSELPEAETPERKRGILSIQRDLIKNLELLYVIFACAVTAKVTGRVYDRLRAISFVSPFPPPQGIPWDPILKVVGAAALVLFAACMIASYTFLGTTKQTLVPTDARDILQLVTIIVIVHLVALGQALALRTRLIGVDTYFADSGRGHAVAYVKIFLKCWIISLLLGLALYSPNLIKALNESNLSALQILWLYFVPQLTWAIVPATCGVMTAYTIDRPLSTRFEQGISGALEAAAMVAAALLAIELTLGKEATNEYRGFVIVLYGGLGFVLGFMLPANIRRHLDAQESRLPDRISMLRTAVRQYFHDIQQFSEWLNARNDKLENKRPLDVLTEDNGLQQLTLFVGNTRQKIVAAVS